MSNLVPMILFVVPFAACWFLVSALSHGLFPETSRVNKVFSAMWRMGIAFGAGVTLASVTVWFFLVWPRVFSSQVGSLHDALPRAAVVEVVLLCFAFSLLGRVRHRVLDVAEDGAKWPSAIQGDLGLQRKLIAVFVMCALFSLCVFATATWSRPLGELDSWAIWNLHARFLFRGGANWTDYFQETINWTHPDYPLAIPLLVTRGWAALGLENHGVPVAVGFFFFLATTGVLMSSLRFLRGTNQALLGGIFLLGTPLFPHNSAAQTADIPLGFYFLGSLVCLFLLEHTRRNREKHALIFLSGLLAGGAVWTKNEGSLWLLFLTAVLVFSLSKTKMDDLTRSHKWGLFAVFIAAATVGILSKFALGRLAPPVELLRDQNVTTLEKLSDVARWKEISLSFIATSQTFGLWACPPAIFLWYHARATGLKTRWFSSDTATERVLALMVCGYFAIYLVTPYPLIWHLTNSVNRLFLQLWPCVIFVFFYHLRTPEEVRENSP